MSDWRVMVAPFIELFKRIDPALWAACGHNPVKRLPAAPAIRAMVDWIRENLGLTTLQYQRLDDMVAAIGQVKAGEWGYVADDIGAVVRAAGGRVVKVIIESAAADPAHPLRPGMSVVATIKTH